MIVFIMDDPMLKRQNRRSFIGGSDARTIMGDDEAALVRLWKESGARSSLRTCRATCWSSSAA
jgi:hypothetical protein